MYHKIEAWLNGVLEQKIPSKVKAFCFNLYEDENESWSIELVGTKTFDLVDEDWACDEITDFWTRYKPFSWKEKADWKEVLSEVVSALKQYLENGLYADVLKSRAGVAVGFVDGNLEILYSDLSGVTEDIEASGEAPDTDFVTFGTPHVPEVQDDMRTSQNEMPKAEKSTAAPQSQGFDIGSIKEICLIIVVVIIMILVMTFGKIISSRDTMGSEGKTQQTDHFDESVTEVMTEDSEAASESAPEAEEDSYLLRYDGFDTGIEIFFKDCVCEYDKDGSRVYTYFVDDPAVEAEGYAIYVQIPDDTMGIFPVKDYRVDRNAGELYMIWDDNTFERIQGVKFVDGMGAYKIMGSYNMKELIAEAYGLESPDDGGDFGDLQVEFTGLFEENGKTVLRGKASALYNASGKKYSIEWEIDTETLHESAKAYLTDFDIHPLYAAFLRNEISVKNPYVPEDSGYNTELSFDDDKDYSSEGSVFRNARKSFSLVDVNNDGNPELVFRMYDSPSELVYILGVQDDELTCYYVHETHTSRMYFTIYDNGIVWWGQSYDGAETICSTFTEDGKERELIHFVREEDSDSDLYYDYYYLEGIEELRFNLQSDEEYERLVSAYEGEEPEWFDCELFADISQNGS